MPNTTSIEAKTDGHGLSKSGPASYPMHGNHHQSRRRHSPSVVSTLDPLFIMIQQPTRVHVHATHTQPIGSVTFGERGVYPNQVAVVTASMSEK